MSRPPGRLNQLNRLIIAFRCLPDHVIRTNTQRYRYARGLRARNQDCNFDKIQCRQLKGYKQSLWLNAEAVYFKLTLYHVIKTAYGNFSDGAVVENNLNCSITCRNVWNFSLYPGHNKCLLDSPQSKDKKPRLNKINTRALINGSLAATTAAVKLRNEPEIGSSRSRPFVAGVSRYVSH